MELLDWETVTFLAASALGVPLLLLGLLARPRRDVWPMVFPMLLFSAICAGMVILGSRTPRKRDT